MFGSEDAPLLRCEPIHELPGRVRLRCRALRYLASRAAEIEERIARLPGVTSARVTTLTGNALVHFDPVALEPESLRESVQLIIGDYSLLAHKAEREARSEQTVNERRLQEESVPDMLVRVAVTSLSLLFSMRGSNAPGPQGLLRRFTTVPALTSLSLAVPIFRSGIRALVRDGRPNADALSASAILASLVSGRDVSALTIIWLADIAELLTAYTMDRTRKAIREMLSVGEERVWRLGEDGTEQQVPLEALRQGDRVLVGAGEKISVDGVVEEGEASIDQASITGEFMPVRRASGEEVFAGTVVKSGRLVVQAREVGDRTAVARIVRMVEEASHRKASIQTFADRFSAGLIPFNFALAGLIYAVTGSAARALSMLIIDYSCGVRLSTATALSASICTAARQHILIKGGNYIELLDEADTMILDKTGTLTEANARVGSVVALGGASERRVMELAAAAEETSSHPLAVAVLERVRRAGWQIPAHSASETHVARGVETSVEGRRVLVGSRRFMSERGIDLAAGADPVARLERGGESVVYVASGSELIGVFGVQDVLRENMKKALNRLRFSRIDDILLLTGDARHNAEVVATRMAVDGYHAELLPEDKAEAVLRMQSKGVRVVMVGDGINDAPALAYADVGIAIGASRTDVAMEASDITIASDDPLLIPGVVNLAKKTMGIVRQNFAISIVVNTAGLLLSSMGVLPVVWGAVLHNATTVLVVANSGRLLFHDVEKSR